MQEVLGFLSQLERNNNRDWFNDHKKDYQKARKIFEDFIGKLIFEIGQFEPDVRGLTASGSIFRINRDTRFSADKTPYKNNFGAHMSRGGKNGGEPGYYFHMQPGDCFISGGIYMPSSEKLKAIRKEIFNFPEDFRALIEDPWFTKNAGLFEDDKLKRPPAGFPSDFELIDYLKYKHYCPFIPLPDSMISSPDLLNFAVDAYKRMKKFNDFINRALEDLNS
jgi:uncharacterized protein (TIGR02453 family)